jgi:hypothetical protein
VGKNGGYLLHFYPKGAAKRKRAEVTYICCGAKKKVVTYSVFFLIDFFDAFFGRFATRGVQKHEKQKSKKIHLGSSQKNVAFFSFFVRFFFFFSLGCLVRFFF